MNEIDRLIPKIIANGLVGLRENAVVYSLAERVIGSSEPYDEWMSKNDPLELGFYVDWLFDPVSEFLLDRAIELEIFFVDRAFVSIAKRMLSLTSRIEMYISNLSDRWL